MALMKQAGVPLDAAVATVAAMDPFDKVPGLAIRLAGKKIRGTAS